MGPVRKYSHDFQHYIANFLGLIDSEAGEMYLDPLGGSFYGPGLAEFLSSNIPSVLKPLVTFSVISGKRNEEMNAITGKRWFVARFQKYVDNNRTLGERERQLARAEFVIMYIPYLWKVLKEHNRTAEELDESSKYHFYCKEPVCRGLLRGNSEVSSTW